MTHKNTLTSQPHSGAPQIRENNHPKWDCDKWIIWGSAGHGKVVRDILLLLNFEIAAIFDNNRAAKSIANGVSIYHGLHTFKTWLKEYREGSLKGAVAIGGSLGVARLELLTLFRESGVATPAVIHPTATIYPSAKIEDGCQIFANSLVGPDCRIAYGTILNHNSNVDHDCEISEGCHVAPGAVLCGCIQLQRNCFIGAGSVILPRLTVGENSIVGAGAVVTKSIPPNSIVAGVPARSTFRNKPLDN